MRDHETGTAIDLNLLSPGLDMGRQGDYNGRIVVWDFCEIKSFVICLTDEGKLQKIVCQ